MEKRAFKKDNLNKNHKTLKQVLNDFYCNSEDSEDLYFVTITDNLYFSEDSLGKIRKAIAGKYVDEHGEMINTNKGIKEIRISSSWLRGIKNESYQVIDNFDPEHLNGTENGDRSIIIRLPLFMRVFLQRKRKK